MKNKKRKSLVVALALVLLSGIASMSATYAYWAASVKAPTTVDKGGSVTVGTGKEVETTLTVGDAVGTGVLVPAGRAEGSQVEYVILTNSVKWKENITTLATGHVGTLSVEVKVGTIKIDNSTDHDSLVNITFQVGGTAPVDGTLGTSSPNIVLEGDAVIVYTKVTLTEPATKEIYDAVAGKIITFDVTFTVAP